MQGNFMAIFYGPEDTQWAKAAPRGVLRGEHNPPGRQEAQARPGGLCPPRVPPDCLFALKIPKYSQNPRGIDEIFIQPPQCPETLDPI